MMGLEDLRTQQQSNICRNKKVADIIPAFINSPRSCMEAFVGEPGGVKLFWSYYGADDLGKGYERIYDGKLTAGVKNTVACISPVGIENRFVTVETCPFSLSFLDENKFELEVIDGSETFKKILSKPAIPIRITYLSKKYYILWYSTEDYHKIADAIVNCLSDNHITSEFQITPVTPLSKKNSEPSGCLLSLIVVAVATICCLMFLF